MPMSATIVVTGASGGVGRAVALEFDTIAPEEFRRVVEVTYLGAILK